MSADTPSGRRRRPRAGGPEDRDTDDVAAPEVLRSVFSAVRDPRRLLYERPDGRVDHFETAKAVRRWMGRPAHLEIQILYLTPSYGFVLREVVLADIAGGDGLGRSREIDLAKAVQWMIANDFDIPDDLARFAGRDDLAMYYWARRDEPSISRHDKTEIEKIKVLLEAVGDRPEHVPPVNPGPRGQAPSGATPKVRETSRELKTVRGRPDADEAPPERWDLVTLNQAAGMVHRHKRTLERYKTRGTLPAPAVEGGGGRPDLYDWMTLRPWLEEEFGIELPETFPANRNR